jgi:hypothetical protein
MPHLLYFAANRRGVIFAMLVFELSSIHDLTAAGRIDAFIISDFLTSTENEMALL